MKSKEFEASNLLKDNIPLDEFFGMTRNDIHVLLYYSYNELSPVQLRNDIDNSSLDRISFFRIVEKFLNIIEREYIIKLTPLGALPKKVMVELYSYKFIPDEFIESGIVKLAKQENCISIQSAWITARIARLVKKTNGYLSLTKTGIKLLKPENRAQLFRTILSTFTEKFSWAFNDGYPDQPIGQLGWAFSILLLHKFGDQKRTVKFYAEKYLAMLPRFILLFDSDFSTPESEFTNCYGIRSFERFLLWFGFVTVEKSGKFSDTGKDKYSSTELIEKLFNFEQIDRKNQNTIILN
jgi:hypothetical protein